MVTRAKENFLVLVADDSDDDRFLLRTAMGRASRLQIVAEVSDGAQVIAYLKGRGTFGDRDRFPLPDLLLLDLKMPVKDGLKVLEWLRIQRELELTVVVLTDSVHPEHIKQALDLGADLFQIKPRSQRELEVMALALQERLVKRAPASSQLLSAHLSY